MLHPPSLPSPPLRSRARRLGFFITTPAAEAQLELDLAEQRCPLDASADRENLYLTLFTFDALDINSHNVTREFRLAEMLQVRCCSPPALLLGRCCRLALQASGAVAGAAPYIGSLQPRRERARSSVCCATDGVPSAGLHAMRSRGAVAINTDLGLRAPPSPPPQDFSGGELSLFFANCEQDSRVNFDVEVALYNVRGGCSAAAPRLRCAAVVCALSGGVARLCVLAAKRWPARGCHARGHAGLKQQCLSTAGLPYSCWAGVEAIHALTGQLALLPPPLSRAPPPDCSTALHAAGDRVDYLPVGEDMLPIIYFVSLAGCCRPVSHALRLAALARAALLLLPCAPALARAGVRLLPSRRRQGLCQLLPADCAALPLVPSHSHQFLGQILPIPCR